MHIVYVYLLGILTPFIMVFIIGVIMSVSDWKDYRRYSRAYKKFTEEYEALSDVDKFKFGETRDSYDNHHFEKDRYFSVKWQYGQTTEI